MTPTLSSTASRAPLARTYRLLRRAWGPAPSARDAIIMLVVLASMITTLAIAQVSRRHDVIRAGYELSRENQRLHALREQRRALEVERATLTHPERLRALATRLGMVPASPDQIRVVRTSRRLAAADEGSP